MIRVLTTLYNGAGFIPKCIASLQMQSVTDFRCYILDDVSTDGSADVSLRLIDGDERFELVKNTSKRYQPGNYQQILQRTEVHAEDIIVAVDGDDWLPDAHVFARVLRTYADPDVWLSWGSFVQCSGGRYSPGFAAPIADVTGHREDAQKAWTASALRTWKAFLWRAIRDEDLRAPNGNYWEATGDMAFMFPMLEMATNTHVRYLPECNYVYNLDNPISDFRCHAKLQAHYSTLIRAMPRYQPLVRESGVAGPIP